MNIINEVCKINRVRKIACEIDEMHGIRCPKAIFASLHVGSIG